MRLRSQPWHLSPLLATGVSVLTGCAGGGWMHGQPDASVDTLLPDDGAGSTTAEPEPAESAGTGSEGTGGGATTGEAPAPTDDGDTEVVTGKFDVGVPMDTEATDDGTGGTTCADLQVTLTPQIPSVVLLLDQSGSMWEDFGGASRWDTVYDVLFNASDGVVKALHQEVRFGMALYTSHEGNSGGICPILTEVDLALGNYAALAATYDAANYDDETPTGESLQAVAAKLATYPEPGSKAIILATDGEPDTCAVPNPQYGQPDAVAAARAAFGLGIRTYMVSVGPDIAQSHMQDMANAGVGAPAGVNAPYFRTTDKAALVAAFRTIIDGVRDCTFTLDGEVQPGFEDDGKVLVDGQPLEYGTADGWRLNSPTELELLGEACKAIQTGKVSIEVSFPCGALVPR